MTKSIVICVLGLFLSAGVFAGTINGNEFIDNEVIIKFKDDSIKPSVALNVLGVEEVGVFVHGFETVKAGLYRFEGASVILVIKELSKNAKVEYAEPNYVLNVDPIESSSGPSRGENDVPEPNDPMFKDLYGMKNSGQTGGTAGADTKAYKAWEISTGSKNVVVAVIDTGVDYTHEDLLDNIYTNSGEMGTDERGRDKKSNGVDDDKNGFIDDWHGWDFANKDNDPIDDHSHGTHCSGTIGGTGNNGKGVVGMNWKVNILPIKFLTGSGSGSLADAVLAIDYATKMKVNLMSNSWGGGGFSKTMEDAITAADKAGILFVAAAGNSKNDNDQKPHYPSSYGVANVLAVAAVDHNAAMASFSSFGVTSVDIGAPGVDILSTITGNQYKKYSGTSMATPHTAGAAALVWAAYPNLSHYDVKARLMGTATPNTSLAGKTVTGATLDVASAMENDEVPPANVSDLKVVGNDITSVNLSWTAVGDDNNNGAASGYVVKYAESKIDTAAAWEAAKTGAIVTTAVKAGEKVNAIIDNLGISKEYYFALKARDNVNNLSAVSNSVSGKTANVMKLFEDDMENLGNGMWKVSGGWVGTTKEAHSGKMSMGLEVAAEEAVIATLDSAPISMDGNKAAFLSVFHKYTMESYNARGMIFVSINGGKTWISVVDVRGISDWKHEFINLTPYLNGAKEVLVKFAHINTSKAVALTWYVDDVVILVKEKE